MLTKAELTRRVRRHAMHEIYDESGCGPLMFAVYSLADPRELRQIRYIGQTSSPRRRLLQHLNAARLAERARIFHSLQEDTPIYNVEREILGGQSLLL
jgi:hypothetical protein